MKNNLLTIFYIFLFTTCTQEQNGVPDSILAMHQSAKLQTILIENLEEYGIKAPEDFIKSGDKCIIHDGQNLYNIYQLDLTNHQKREFFPCVCTRSGSTQLNTLSADTGDNWSAFDFNSGQLYCQPNANTRSGNTSTIQLPTEEQHLWAVKAGDYILSTGLYEQGRYLQYSPEDKEAKYFLSYPTHPAYPDLKEKTKSILYSSNVLKVRPDNHAFVCADLYSGSMDICRLENGEVSLIRRLIISTSNVKIEEKGKYPTVAYTPDNHFGFTDVSVTNHAIYAIYSGQTYRQNPKNFQRCRKLFIFDWDGNLIKNYELDTDIISICYDQQESTLYGIGYQPQTVLVRIPLPEEYTK